MPSKHAVSVSLTEHLNRFVRTEIASGRYRTASEVVRAGLRLLEAQVLQHSLQEGGQPGRPETQAMTEHASQPSSVAREAP